MKMAINFRNLARNGKIVGYIDRRTSFAFARMRHKIEEVNITLSDINGQKGGVDKQCQVVVKPLGLRRIVVAERSDKALKAIDRCLGRASQSLSRKLKRRQMQIRTRLQAGPLRDSTSANYQPIS